MAIRRSLLDTVYASKERAFMKHFPDAYGQSNFVEGEGSDEPCPLVMVIGEAPGAQEDVRRRPFVGQSGIILRMLMAHAGLNMGTPRVAGNTWLTNVVNLRPPRNRTPTDPEIELAKPYLIREWQAIGRPRVIITLGNTPLKTVTGWASVSKRAGASWDGEEYVSQDDGIRMFVWPMLHPANAVRQPSLQSVIEDHWKMFAEWFKRLPL